MERLGLGPDICLARNPKLVYGRMTGWGQDGPIAHTAGHDINYIALSGALYSIGPAGGPPVPPLNLIGDFGGGALYLAMGVLAGIISARATGKGQVIDCSMVEGSASLMMMMYGALAAGAWVEKRGSNRTDGGAHYYHVYETKDGEHVAIGSIEPQFYALLLQHTGLEGESLPEQTDRTTWPDMRARLARIFKTEDPRGMDRDHGADRYLLRAGAAHVGGDARIRTTSIAAALSRWTASRSRVRRRAFSARRAGCSARRRGSASTPTRSSGTGGFRPTRLRRCIRPGRWPRQCPAPETINGAVTMADSERLADAGRGRDAAGPARRRDRLCRRGGACRGHEHRGRYSEPRRYRDRYLRRARRSTPMARRRGRPSRGSPAPARC